MLLFSFLALSSSLINPSYSLLPPFIHTSIGEIGNWSIRGQAVSQKRIIHLTSSVGSKSGGMCQLIPTNSEDWGIEIEISFIHDTFIFNFGPQLCPNISLKFINAFNLSFTPSESEKNTVQVKLSGPEIFPSVTGSFGYDFHPNKIRFRIFKENRNLTLSTVDSSGNHNQILTHKIGSLYSYGYLSFLSISPNPIKCNNTCITNIYSVAFFPLSSTLTQPDIQLIQRNRKYLEENKKKHQLYKMLRRAKMPAVSHYIEEYESNHRILNNDVEKQFSDSLVETKEIVLRARQCISAKNLSDFINNQMLPVVDRAASRYERVADALFDMKTEMSSLWEDVSKELKTMNYDIKRDCDLFENEVIAVSQKMKTQLDKLDKEIFPIPRHVGFAGFMITFPIERILFVICLIEFVAYFVFFLRYHKKTIRKHL